MIIYRRKDVLMKVITVCGSLKFKDEMMKISEIVELQGNCVITPIYPTKPNKDDYTEEEFAILNIVHRKKIEIADAILVVNVDGYIGSSTQNEIEYAKDLGKEIIYYTDLIDQ